nr:AMP-binding protein [Kineosporia babensis]
MAAAFAAWPDRTALFSGEGPGISYAELDRATIRLASRLQQAAPGNGRVYVLGHHSIEATTAALAVLRSGLTYTPLNPELPGARIDSIIEELGGGLVLACDERWQDRGEVPARTEWRRLGAVELAETAADAAAGLLPDPGLAVAYSILTSGSTGEPKPVEVGHEGLLHLCRGQSEALEIGPGDRLLQFASLAFDASIAEIMVALHAGATLCLPPVTDGGWLASVTAFLRKNPVDFATLPPTVYRLLGASAQRNIRTMVFVGEALEENEFLLAQSHGRVLNAYGPTEATVCATIGELKKFSRSVGYPLPGFSLYVLDETAPGGGLSEQGTGELVLCGPGVALGYHGRAREAFGEHTGLRTYRTGDVVTLGEDGAVVFHGRQDDQFKRLGHRISRSELENRWSTVLGRAAWCVRRDEEVVLVCEQDTLASDLLEKLRRVLAPWEVPNDVRQLAQVPLQASGKLDREAIEQLLEAAPADEPPPAQTLVAQVELIAKGVLGFTPEADRTIFDQGADSFTFVTLQVELGKVYGDELVESIFTKLDFDFVSNDFVHTLHELTQAPDSRAIPGPPAPSAQDEAEDSFLLSTRLLEEFEAGLTTATRPSTTASATGVVLTGARGFIGGHLLNRLLSAERDVVALTSSDPASLPVEHTRRFGGPGQVPAVAMTDVAGGDLLAGRDVIHSGYTVNHSLPLSAQHTRNIIPTLDLIRAACEQGARRFVFLSATSSGPSFRKWGREAWDACQDPYSQAKLICEEGLHRARRFGLDVTVLRLPLVYGHRPADQAFLENNVFLGVVRAALAVGALPETTGAFPLCHVDTVTDAVLEALESPGTERFVSEAVVTAQSLAGLAPGRLVTLLAAAWLARVEAAGVMAPEMLTRVRQVIPMIGQPEDGEPDGVALISAALRTIGAAR